MASDDDLAAASERRRKRKVRKPKAAKAAVVDNQDQSTPAEDKSSPPAVTCPPSHTSEPGASPEATATEAVRRRRVRIPQAPDTTVAATDGVDDDDDATASVHAARQSVAIVAGNDHSQSQADNGSCDQLSTDADSCLLDAGDQPSVVAEESELFPQDDMAPQKSRRNRKVKIANAKKQHTPGPEQPEAMIGDSSLLQDGASDWFTAVANGDVTTVKQLLSQQAADVNETNEYGSTALHIAAETKNSELAEALLIVEGLDVDKQNSDGETALCLSARAADTALVARLLQAGADANATGREDGSTSLHCACQDGDAAAVVRLLLDGGARADTGRRSARSGVTGITALHDAADVGDAESVTTLLDGDETLADAVTDRGCTALHVAARHGYADIVDALIARRAYVRQPGADSRGLGVQPLHLAAENGRVVVVRALLSAGADVDAEREFCGKTGVTALHLSVMRRHADVTGALLDSAANVNAGDVDGATALHVAARGGVADAAALLVDRGALVDATTRQQRVHQRHGHRGARAEEKLVVGQAFGQTPLHFAVRYGHLDVAALLLQGGCDVNAAEQMYVDDALIRRQLPREENVKATGPSTSTFKSGPAATVMKSETARLVDGYTALHWAVENDDSDAVRLLIDSGADVDRAAAFDAHAGVTPLHLAAQDGRADIARELLRRGAAPNPHKSTRNRDSITPLHQAVYNDHPATAAALLAAGCDANVQADNGYTALHYAAQKGSAEMTRVILDAGGADVTLRATTRDQRDITALHLAVQSGSVDVVRALAAAGAPIDAGKRMGAAVSGVTALHQAVYQDREEIVAALLAVGAAPDKSMDGWYTPLHVAAERGCVAILRRLLDAIASSPGGGGGVNARATLGEHVDLTPLHVAAQHGHRKTVELLLHAGADAAARRQFGDRSGITALHLAAENGFADAATALMDVSGIISPPLVDAQDSLGFTALHLAVQYQFADVVRALLSAGADESLCTDADLTARQIADELDSLAIRQLLRSDPSWQAHDKRQTLPATRPTGKAKIGKWRSLLCGTGRR